ncbi:MAG: hypothetical protein HYY97_12710 [Rhodocyclales bacterium]|nr:hypothetical protein [Rhodocyclales bacterium]
MSFSAAVLLFPISYIFGDTWRIAAGSMVAFYGIWPDVQVAKIALAQYLLKTGGEVVTPPLTYRIAAFHIRV